jgi:hypothetical protein
MVPAAAAARAVAYSPEGRVTMHGFSSRKKKKEKRGADKNSQRSLEGEAYSRQSNETKPETETKTKSLQRRAYHLGEPSSA